MRLYLVRHGKAVDEGYRFDEDRPLTDDGRERMRRTAKAWAKHGDPAPEAWLVSPLVRAVQTCEICVDAFGQDGPVEVSRAITPEGPVSAAVDVIEHATAEVLAVVSHEPLCSELSSFLLQRSFPRDFKKGAVLALDLERGRARFVWFLEPAKEDKDPKFRDEL